MPLNLVVNGESRDLEGLEPGASVAEAITSMGLKADRIAMERNGEIVSRTRWASTALAAGDRLEIVHFVGGGC